MNMSRSLAAAPVQGSGSGSMVEIVLGLRTWELPASWYAKPLCHFWSKLSLLHFPGYRKTYPEPRLWRCSTWHAGASINRDGPCCNRSSDEFPKLNTSEIHICGQPEVCQLPPAVFLHGLCCWHTFDHLAYVARWPHSLFFTKRSKPVQSNSLSLLTKRVIHLTAVSCSRRTHETVRNCTRLLRSVTAWPALLTHM